MKVLIISTNEFSHNGVTNVILNYHRAMKKNDIIYDFVVNKNIIEEYRTELESNGSRVYLFDRRKNPISYVFKLAKLLRSNKYDIVHTHGNGPNMVLEMCAAKLARVKVRLPHIHTTISETKKKTFSYRVLNKLFTKSFSRPLACSYKVGENFYRDENFIVINNGIDSKRFAYSEKNRKKIRESLGIEDKTVIGHIGHFTYPKNQEFLVELLNYLLNFDDNLSLVLVGDGRNIESAKALVTEKGLNDYVHFYGKSDKVHEILSAFDLFILPSRFEGFPLSVIEAQAAGLPCLLSNNITTEVNLTEKVKFEDLNSSLNKWADKINKLLMNSSQRQFSSEKAIKNIETAGFDIYQNALHLEELYRNLLRK